MTKKTIQRVSEFVAAAYAIPKRGRVSEGVSAGRGKLKSSARSIKFVRMEEAMLSEVETNPALATFAKEEIERIAQVFGLSLPEVTALYRSRR